VHTDKITPVLCKTRFKETESQPAHAYNPSYSGGRDQEDRSLKPAQANSSRNLILKNPSQKRAGGLAQGEGPEFKPQYKQNKTETKRARCTSIILATQEVNYSWSRDWVKS
jgi:hypothetical protein